MLETLGSLGVASFIVNRAGQVLEANSTASDVFGYSQRELDGIDMSRLVIDFTDKFPLKSASYYSECISSSGKAFSCNVSIAPVSQEHAIEEGVSIIAVRETAELPHDRKRAQDKDRGISVFNYVARALAGPKNIDRSIREIVGRLPSLLHCDAGWVHLASEAGQLELLAQEGCTETCVKEMRHLEPGQCLTGKVYTSGRPIVVKDLSCDVRDICKSLSASALKSLASVPILSSGNVFGVLTLASREKSFFDSFDMQMLSAVGIQLGVALENARLLTQIQKRMEQIELINEVSSNINSSLSIGTVFRIVVTEVRKMVGFDRASLLLYREKEDNLQILALETKMKTIMPKGVTAPMEGTSAGWAVRHNEPYINTDLREDIPFPLDSKLYDEGIRSTISIPLYQDKVFGVLNLDSIEPMNYSQEDLQLLVPISKHISIALENTLLFEEVSREKMEWEKTFDSITDMVWIEDNDNNVVRANQALLDKAGIALAELMGMHCTSLLAKIGIESVTCLCEDVPASERQTFKEIRESSGSVFQFWTYPLKDEEGRLYATVHYLKDVTSHKRIEQQLFRNDKLASLGILVAGIAHEINNPLGIIAGYSEALLDRAYDSSLLEHEQFEDFPEYLETIHKEIFRCKEILGSLLEFARPHSGKTRVLDINEIIMEVMLLVKHKAKSLNYNMDLLLNRDIPKVDAEPGSLRQLFMNVIINAMFYTPEGGTVRIWTGVDDEGEKDSATCRQMLSISVSDTGSGISEDIIDRIFDPFFTTKPTGVGAGLGLSICHRIAEEHGGTIDVKSSPGEGSVFTIKLPTVKDID